MILITGASRGIGKYLFEHYIASNQPAYGTYLQTSSSPHPNLSKVDVREFAEVEEWVNLLMASHAPGQLVLLNCAGATYNSFAHKADPVAWENILRINVLGTFNCIRACLPYMRSQRHGRIVNFCSVVAQKGVPGTSAYAASKAALWGLSRSVSAENASLGITINNINLGYFDIGMIEQVPSNLLDKIVTQIPAGKLGSSGQILKTVEYLLDNDYITGSSIDINGGLI